MTGCFNQGLTSVECIQRSEGLALTRPSTCDPSILEMEPGSDFPRIGYRAECIQNFLDDRQRLAHGIELIPREVFLAAEGHAEDATTALPVARRLRPVGGWRGLESIDLFGCLPALIRRSYRP